MITSAERALAKLNDAVSSWRRRLYPADDFDPLDVANQIKAEREAKAELEAAVAIEREQRAIDNRAAAAAKEIAEKESAEKVKAWDAALYPKEPPDSAT